MLNFAHISDIHMLKNYSGTIFENVIKKFKKSPTDNFKDILKKILCTIKPLDFVLITGDLVNDGNEEDYREFKDILNYFLKEIPFYLCLGNHDKKHAFRRGFLGEENGSSEIYYYEEEIKNTGIRIIALDSCNDYSGSGFVNEPQLNWLKEKLKVKTERGTILIVHHPLYVNQEGSYANFSLKNSKDIIETIKGSDVIGVFSGHDHYSTIIAKDGIVNFVASSTSFGMNISSNYLTLNNKIGYNICELNGTQLYVYSENQNYETDSVKVYI